MPEAETAAPEVLAMVPIDFLPGVMLIVSSSGDAMLMGRGRYVVLWAGSSDAEIAARIGPVLRATRLDGEPEWL